MVEKLDPQLVWQPEVSAQDIFHPGIVNSEVAGDRFQFERLGYFCGDKSMTAERLIFNRTVELRDTWARLQKQA